VADPGCLSQIPDPTFLYPGSRIQTVSITNPGSQNCIKELIILTLKNAKQWFLSSQKYDQSYSSRIQMFTIFVFKKQPFYVLLTYIKISFFTHIPMDQNWFRTTDPRERNWFAHQAPHSVKIGIRIHIVSNTDPDPPYPPESQSGY